MLAWEETRLNKKEESSAESKASESEWESTSSNNILNLKKRKQVNHTTTWINWCSEITVFCVSQFWKKEIALIYVDYCI